MTGPSPLLFQCVFYDINYLCSSPDGMVSYLVALDIFHSIALLLQEQNVSSVFKNTKVKSIVFSDMRPVLQ